MRAAVILWVFTCPRGTDTSTVPRAGSKVLCPCPRMERTYTVNTLTSNAGTIPTQKFMSAGEFGTLLEQCLEDWQIRPKYAPSLPPPASFVLVPRA
jgi:hypothetical protein